MQRNFLWIFSGPEDSCWAKEVPRWVVPTSVASCTAFLLYKYPDILETLGETTQIHSSHRKFQKRQIQSRHHHEGAHHPHWCLSDDA